MHRNTLLVTAILAVIAALLIGISIGRSLNRPGVSQSPTPTLSPSPTLAYLSASACGVSFTYPNFLKGMESSTSGAILVNTTNPNDSIVIVCQENIPRVPLPPEKIETIALTGTASVSAKLYHDASAKNGAPIDKLIFTHPKTKLDVFIAGYGPVFRELITSLTVE